VYSSQHQLSFHRYGDRMPYGITQCYLPPGSGENPAFTSSRSRYSIWRPWRDARLSWPMLRKSGPAGNWTRDLQIACLTPYRSATTQHVTCDSNRLLFGPVTCNCRDNLPNTAGHYRPQEFKRVQKFGEIWTCGSWEMNADKQSGKQQTINKRTDRQTDIQT